MVKVAFFDLDGTVRRSRKGLCTPFTRDDVVIIDGVKERMQDLKKDGYLVVAVTNQGGNFAQDYSTPERCEDVMKHTNRQLGGVFNEMLYCRHYPNDKKKLESFRSVNKVYIKDCNCRKPKTGMGEHIINKYNVDDLENSFMVGDMEADRGFAEGLGIKFIHIDKFLSIGNIAKKKKNGEVTDSKEYVAIENRWKQYADKVFAYQSKKFPYWLLDRLFTKKRTKYVVPEDASNKEG